MLIAYKGQSWFSGVADAATTRPKFFAKMYLECSCLSEIFCKSNAYIPTQLAGRPTHFPQIASGTISQGVVKWCFMAVNRPVACTCV